MFGFKMYCLVIYSLFINLTYQNQRKYTEEQKNCIDEIRFFFRNTYKDKPRLYYAQQALLYMRASQNPNLDTFTNEGNNIVWQNSKDYYIHIREYIQPEEHFKIPEIFCAEKRTMNSGFLDAIEGNQVDAETRCLAQLTRIGISLATDHLVVLQNIYDTVVLNEIDPEYKLALEYIELSANNFEVNTSMMFPADFCIDLFQSDSAP